MPHLASLPAGGDGLVVEFLGLPGSGKSTLSHAAARELRAREIPVFEPTYTLDHALPPGARRTRKLAYAALTLLRHPARSAVWLRRIARSGQRRAAWSAAVGVNWLYLLEVARRGSQHPGVHLLDQGLLQALWSIGYGARALRLRSPALRMGLRTVLPPRTMVVLVTAGRGALEQRLDDRRTHAASRLERERASGRPGVEAPMARAAALLAAVVELARRLAEQRRITLLTIESAEGSLDADVATITGAVLARLPRGAAAGEPAGSDAPPAGSPAALPQ